MKKIEWAAQYKHPNWQRKRLEALAYYNWECSNCGDKDAQLHVHHKRYVKGRQIWEYEPKELDALCEGCHEEEHYIKNELAELLTELNSTEVLALLRGYSANADFDPWIGDAGRDRDPFTYAIGGIAMLLKFIEHEKYAQIVETICAMAKPTSEAIPLAKQHRHIWAENLGLD
jgi:hypothetical protein